MNRILSLLFVCLFVCKIASAEIEAVWLSYTNADTDKTICLNWATSEESQSNVKFFNKTKVGIKKISDKKVKFHSVEIPVKKVKKFSEYKITDDSGAEFSSKIKLPQGKELRVVFVGNLGFARGLDFSAIVADNPDIVFTCGDNVPALHKNGKPLNPNDIFLAAIKKFPRELLSSVPFMPILGNHDKEIRERGKKYPKENSYDSTASAYCQFFNLPQPEWHWNLHFKKFNTTFIALDLCHVRDFGTTWQACHPYDADSEQFKNFVTTLDKSVSELVFTLINCKKTDLFSKQGKIWRPQFERCQAVISGFGYFLERAKITKESKTIYYNTSLRVGAKYPDPYSSFFASKDGYLLLTISDKSWKSYLKTLNGEILDEWSSPETK